MLTCPYFWGKTLFWISPWTTPLSLLYQLFLIGSHEINGYFYLMGLRWGMRKRNVERQKYTSPSSFFHSYPSTFINKKKNYSRKERRGGDKGTEGSGFTPAAGCLQLQHIHLLSCGCIWLCLCVTGATRKGSGVSDREKDYRFGLWKTKYLPVLISWFKGHIKQTEGQLP